MLAWRPVYRRASLPLIRDCTSSGLEEETKEQSDTSSLDSHGLTDRGFKHFVLYLQVENDFAQKHVFQCCDGSGAVDGVVALERLKEVGVGRLPVLLLGRVDDPCNRDNKA